jgi:hypothetical protein
MTKILSSKENVTDTPPINKTKKGSKRNKFNHTVVKCKLITVLKNKNWITEIKNTVKHINMIKSEVYFFFNQYILAAIENDLNPITFDSNIFNIEKEIDFIKYLNNFTFKIDYDLDINKFDINKINNFFNYKTIERCVLFVLGRSNTIRKYDDEYNKMKNVYEYIYLPLGENKIKKLGDHQKSIKKPFEYISRELMINIVNHINLNFKRFQRSLCELCSTEAKIN